jgi:pimeloyl-ACP methyl ester carboxylesterase
MEGTNRNQMILKTVLNAGFISETAMVNGAGLHYLRGGEGPALILVHGFPQDWSEYHAIMPDLAKQFTVIAVDLRGIGGSTAQSGGYDAANMAEDIYQLASTLGLKDLYVVGHDLGGMVAYALVRRYPELLTGAMILDQVIPGMDGWEQVQSSPAVWHIHFMQLSELPEKLISGRQSDYLGHFLSFGKFSPDEIAQQLQAYAAPAQLHAALEMYRAFPANVQFNQEHRGPNDVPLFVGAGAGSPFAALLPKIADGLRASGFAQVQTGLLPNSIHYVVADNPKGIANLIIQYGTSS